MRTFVMSVCLALVAAASLSAQTADPRDLTVLTLEELMELKIEVVSSASKFAQEVTSAPASISIVTGEEIRRFGHRTLKDVLDSIRGLYTTDDRNYSYAGVRGFARPGDYNTRVLLLIDGHRVNDPLYDMARIGEDLLLDVESIDRVEFIRGPGSSLYGTNAFFGVINVITRKGWQQEGIRVDVERGSLDAWRGRVGAGRRFDNGADLSLSISALDAQGHPTLYFPEFDSPDTNFGAVRNLDAEQSRHVFGSLSFGRFSVRGGYGERSKQVPTASYGSTFGDTRFETRDAQGLAEVAYDGALGRGWTGVARASYDRYAYSGDYPTPYDDSVSVLYRDSGEVDWLSGELTLNRRVAARHLLTTGVEWRRPLRQLQRAYDDFDVYVDDSRKTYTWGAYVQDEVTLLSHVRLNAGTRVDYFDSFGTQVTPRGALIYQPVPQTAFKLLHGRAFRAPNAYELYYYGAQATMPEVMPETISTTEGTWEQYFGSHLRSSVSLFRSHIDDLITQASLTGDGDDDGLYFRNLSTAQARGVEAEIEGRWAGDLLARFSHSVVATEDATLGATLTNSPQHISKIGVIIPVAGDGSVGVEGQYLGDRLTLRQDRLPGVLLTNVTLVSGPLLPRTQISLALHNAFNQRYSMPGAEEHAQHAIEQDGRSLRLRLTVGF